MKNLSKAPKTSNLSWLFYKDYFKDEKGNPLFRDNKNTKDIIEDKTRNILNQKLVKYDSLELEHYLELTTTYPGLLIGSGYQHEIGGVDSEFQLGFFFDYTTGMPVVLGSSVKGVLRSVFPYDEEELEKLEKKYQKDKKAYEKIVALNVSKESYIKDLLSDEVDVFELKKEIFEQMKDKFFDAFIVKSENRNETFLDDDYITPHNNKYKDPVPLRFLKVSPNVTFRFYFDLKSGLIAEEKKLFLFDQILQDMGVGAKTNVGYGQLAGNNKDRIEKNLKDKAKEIDEKQKVEALKNMSPVDKIFIENDDNTVKIIQLMQSSEIEEYDSIKFELADRVKTELQKDPKTWERAKQKALKRKEFIEIVLRGEE